MLRRVVRGDRAGGCTLDVVIMMGFELEALYLDDNIDSSSGEQATEGPLREDVRDRCKAGLDFAAISARAAARSG